jgi:hypothetical protein
MGSVDTNVLAFLIHFRACVRARRYGTIDSLSAADPSTLKDEVARKGGKIQLKVATEIKQLAQERQGLLDAARAQ